ncbi:APC family permease [Patulibacter defluvii]|uniref:APC family permease n=1 Tax=Patulibacter defluvii TaxID=3095358 RepID=UPI002A74C0D5|nr:APC family permease [Patulibacter sp. DM4]
MSSETGTATEAGGLERTMTWRDAFSLAATLPGSALAIIGYSTGILGAWSALAVWGIASLIAFVQNFLYAELASAFPDKAGGISLYAHEVWKRHCSPIGAVASVGYWAGWAFALAFNGLAVGSLVKAQWFADADWSFSTGTVDVGLEHLIAAGAIVGVWLLNVLGIRLAVRVSYAINLLALAVLLIVIVLPVVTGDLDLGRLSWGIDDQGSSWLVVGAVWLFLAGWTVYGTEIAATFSPEYRDPRRDTPRALISSGAFSLVIFALVPVVTAGVVGERAMAENPVGFNVGLFEQLLGGAGWIVVVVLCLALFNLMSVATADSGRALYGMARDGLTVRGLDRLNRRRMPARAMTVGLVLNLGLVFFVGNQLGIVFAANLGYMLAVVAATSGYVLLRRERDQRPRSYRLPRPWTAVAAAVALLNLALLVTAALNPGLAGYGGVKEELIGFGVLAVGVLLFAYRRVVQDGAGLRLREPPTVPAPSPVTATEGAPE